MIELFGKLFFICLFLNFFILEQSKDCHSDCEDCYEYSEDENNKKCISCIKNLFLIYNTTNCDSLNIHKNYYYNKSDSKLYPCEIFKEKHCYECNPFLQTNTEGICLSCIQGYKFNKETYECEKCKENEVPVIINDFLGCNGGCNEYTICEKYITSCLPLENGTSEIICPETAPIYDTLSKSCYEFECPNEGLRKGNCYFQNKKYENKQLFINWFNNEYKYIRYPSYNVDNSGYLLIELTGGLDFSPNTANIVLNSERKLYFYNEEGRGLFDELNDVYEKKIEYEKKFVRLYSTSIFIKLNDSEGYRYFLNFENCFRNLEMYDLKTGEISYDNIFSIGELFLNNIANIRAISIQMMELNEKNKFLIAGYFYYRMEESSQFKLVITLLIFEFVPTNKNKINVYSLHRIQDFVLAYSNFEFDEDNKFFVIQTKSGNFLISAMISIHYLILINNNLNNFVVINILFDNAFHKLLLLKDETFILCYFPDSDNHNTLNVLIAEYLEKNQLNEILKFGINIDLYEGIYYYSTDMILLNEYRMAFAAQKMHRKKISIFIFDFFDNYKNVIINMFKINIYEQKMNILYSYSLLFKYKDLLGFQFENTEGKNGFVLFGYFNSTDPKQILNIKTDGLNYKIILGNYLNLQSNIFGYQKKCIKIIQIPNITESGLYLISNATKKLININDCIDFNTEISLTFAYNSIIKQGNYLFKFAGILEESNFDLFSGYFSDLTLWTNKNEKYKEIFNNRRNMNITGKIALVRINALNNIKVFCDDKYNNTSLKDKEGNNITCGIGKFYDVKNANEITQLDLGKKYYFDKNKNVFIKCNEKCKKCSREFNETNMNCDECYDNFFLRNDNCLEFSKCEFNYYYDNYNNFNLKCIDKNNYCPDFKPYQNITTKECIEKCDIKEFNNICIPTNNPLSINETYKKIFEHSIDLNLETKLIKDKEKYTIIGNNVSFIFTTSEIELKELYYYKNSSSIILNDCEKVLKKRYSINDEDPIPILKIEQLNNYSNNIELYYELFHPRNFSLKLDLNFCFNNYIEIRFPLVLKKYKMDLVIKTANSGYNIFDLNDSFYNDICSAFSYNDSDISLSERKTLLDLSDENLCINGCNQSNFDIKTLRSICKCKINANSNYSDDLYEEKDSNKNNREKEIFNILKQNINISKTSNIKVVKCFSIIFTKKIFTENYGFYIMFLMNFFNIILLFFSPIPHVEKKLNEFCRNVLEQMETIYNKIKIKDKIQLLISKENKENNINNRKKLKARTPKVQNNIVHKTKGYYNNKHINIINMNTQNIDLFSNTSKTKLNKTLNALNKSENAIDFNKDIILSKEINDIKKKEEEIIIEKIKEKNNSDYYIFYVIKYIPFENRKLFLSESEIENLSYKNALEIENRNRADFYFALLKEKNKIISIFLNDNDYNISIVKISLFLFNFNLSLTTNALFFNDEAIFEINQDQGYFSLSTQITRVLYSTIISCLISFVVELFALSHEDIIKLRNYKILEEAKKFVPNLIRKLKFKFILYFGITIFFNIIFFYYITAFCAIYSIIQTHMISDSLMSFLLAISYSLIISMISSFFRVSSLKKESKLRHFFYLISWILSLI